MSKLGLSTLSIPRCLVFASRFCSGTVPRRRVFVIGLLLTVLSTASAGWSQSPAHVWSQRFGSTGMDQGTSIGVDGEGNVLVTGHFQGSVDFGGWTMSSAGDADIFVAKYDSAGTRLWSHRFGGSGSDRGYGIAVDDAGNILVTGYFSGSVDFGGGPLESAGRADIFVARYDASGSHLWSRRFGGVGADAGLSIAQNENGNIFVTGWFAELVDFGGERLTSAGDRDVFVARFRTDGTHVWSQRFGGIEPDAGTSIATDGAGDVVVTGHFSDTVDFGEGPVRAVGGRDIFVAKYDAAMGTHLWSRQAGATGDDDGWSIATDGEGRVLVTGSFRGTVDFGGEPMSSAGRSDIFVTKYDADGTHLWSRCTGDFDHDDGWGIATDGSGNVLITGRFRGTVDFGGGPLTGRGKSEIFLAAYDAAGEHISSASFGTERGQGLGVAVSRIGSVFMTGDFEGWVNFGGDLLMSSGDSDIYVVKFSAPPMTIRPEVRKKSARDGFTLLLTMGVGWQQNGFLDQTESGRSGVNIGIGKFSEENFAVMFRISGSTVTFTKSSGASLESITGFVGLSGQGWIHDRFTLEGGVGYGRVDTGSQKTTLVPLTINGQPADPLRVRSDDIRGGVALLVAGAWSFFQSGNSSLQVGFEYTPIFASGTHHNISVNVGWQLL